MPTATKVHFSLEALKQHAVGSLDERIAVAEAEATLLSDENAYLAEVEAWRARQEQKLSDLFRQLDTINDLQLATFRLDPYPERDRADRTRARRRVEDLKALRSQIAAKAASLVPDESGNVQLTKTQLQDIFGL